MLISHGKENSILSSIPLIFYDARKLREFFNDNDESKQKISSFSLRFTILMEYVNVLMRGEDGGRKIDKLFEPPHSSDYTSHIHYFIFIVEHDLKIPSHACEKIVNPKMANISITL
jgi:hypothetical protein